MPDQARWSLLALAALALGCARPPALADLRVTPDAITPNADGDADVAQIAYAVGAPALVSIDLVGEDGRAHALRARQPRSAGQYVAEFGGVIDGRMLPDGRYTVRIVAEPRPAGAAAGDDGLRAADVITGTSPAGPSTVQTAPSTAQTAPSTAQTAPSTVLSATLGISDADTEPPVLAGFTVQPGAFTPNQDGLGDRVSISYRLDTPADVRLTLVDADKQYVSDILEDVEFAEPPGQPGPKQYDFDAGVDADAPPPPDGRYYVVAEARDSVGNISRQELPLTIRDGGRPRAAIVGDVAWSTTVLPLGATLAFTATVENIGGTPIRTRGPAPGFLYDNNQTFNRQLPAGFLLLARTGGKPGNPGYRAGSRYVLLGDRTAIAGADLELVGGGDGSGEAEALGGADSRALASPEGTVAGTIGPQDDTPSGAPATREDSLSGATPEGSLSGALATPEDAPAVVPGLVPPTRRVTLCGSVRDGGRPVPGAEVFAFEIDGDRGERAVAGADGGYCFDELAVPPPDGRTFARSSGAIRLGLEYDEKRVDLEYPYRWQLGRTVDLDVCESENQRYLCLPPGARVAVTGAVRFVEPPYRRATNAYLALMHEDVRRMHGPYGVQRVTVEY